jgi:peptidyl-prolyl cis-trans isomerase C
VAREQTAQQLKTSAEERALRQYVSILAVQADMVGVDLQDAQSPLVQ